MADTTVKSGVKPEASSPKTSRKTGKKTGGGTASAKQPTTRKTAAGSRTGGRLAIVFIVLVLIGAALAGGYIWQQRTLNARAESSTQLNARLNAQINARIGDMEKRLDAFQADQKDLNDRVKQLNQGTEKLRGQMREEMREEIQVLSDSVAALRAEFGRSVDRWTLEEVERVLVIANQHLQLSTDAEMAAKALKFADDRLRRLTDPALGTVRKILADEIVSLQDAQAVDVVGTLDALSVLARDVHDLPLAGDVRDLSPANDLPADSTTSPTADPNGDSSLWAAGKNFLADLSALVQVEVDGVAPILSTELRLMMFEKTGLILESSQLAFLRGHKEVYAARMAAAKNWVTANFDTESAEVGAWLERWAVLAAVSPEAQSPDISGSLRALREVMDAGN